MTLGTERWWFSRAAFALFAAVSVLAAAVVGGQRYFYCAQMDEARLHQCCASPAEPGHGQVPSIDLSDCCAPRHFATPAPGTCAQPEPPPRAPLVALLPAVRPAALGTLAASIWIARLARAGPRDARPRERRRLLMVSLS